MYNSEKFVLMMITFFKVFTTFLNAQRFQFSFQIMQKDDF